MDLRPIDKDTLSTLINGLRDQRDWVKEVNDLSEIITKLKSIGKSTSVRDLSNVICKSKSWIGVSFILERGLKVYPEIRGLRSRNEAYEYVKRKQKLRRFLE